MPWIERLVVPSIMDKVRPGWRERVAAQRSSWKVFEIFAIVLLTFALWLLAVPRISGELHAVFHHSDAVRIPDPFRASMSIWTFCALFPVLAPTFTLAGITVNWVESLFNFTRVRAEKGSEEHPELTIRAANRGLLRALAWISIVAVPLFIIGSIGPWTPRLA
jgi:hypothetical protein